MQYRYYVDSIISDQCLAENAVFSEVNVFKYCSKFLIERVSFKNVTCSITSIAHDCGMLWGFGTGISKPSAF